MKLTDELLQQYLEELLPTDQAAEVERLVRSDPRLRQRLDILRQASQEQVHTLAAIWRRRRLGCPSREVLGSHLIGALSPGWQDYVTFHLQVVECPYCQASLEDLRRQRQESPHAAADRRRRFFESSRGGMPGRPA